MEIEGSRVNSVFYHNGDGFTFRKSYVKGQALYVQCTVAQCKGRGKIDLGLGAGDRRVTTTKGHVVLGVPHGPDFENVEKIKLMATIKRQVAVENTGLRAIFDRECER
jgi:hypothetical protein